MSRQVPTDLLLIQPCHKWKILANFDFYLTQLDPITLLLLNKKHFSSPSMGDRRAINHSCHQILAFAEKLGFSACSTASLCFSLPLGWPEALFFIPSGHHLTRDPFLPITRKPSLPTSSHSNLNSSKIKFVGKEKKFGLLCFLSVLLFSSFLLPVLKVLD